MQDVDFCVMHNVWPCTRRKGWSDMTIFVPFKVKKDRKKLCVLYFQ